MPRYVDINAETGEVFITEIPDPVKEASIEEAPIVVAE